MLAARIIYPIDEGEWEIAMVFQPKKHNLTWLIICVDFWELKKVTLTDPFLTPFVEKIPDEIVGHECYSLTHGFLG